MTPRDDRNTNFRGADPYAACDAVLLISGDRDLHPAVKMVADYGVKPVIFRPGREITDDDLKHTMLPDRILRENGTEITWDDYVTLKTGQGRW